MVSVGPQHIIKQHLWSVGASTTGMIKKLRAEFDEEKNAQKVHVEFVHQFMALGATEGTHVASESGKGSSQGCYAKLAQLSEKDKGP